MRISKYQLAESGKKYYRFFFKKQPIAHSYWTPMIENDIVYNSNSSEYEGIFFAEESDVMKWFDKGDTLTEVVFDKNHPSFPSLPEYYFCESGKYCGRAIICGNFISLNSNDMIEFIKKHACANKSTLRTIQQHLVLIRAFNTLRELWEYQYNLFGEDNRESNEKEAMILLTTYHIHYENLDYDKILRCKTFKELVELFSEDKWKFYCK